MEKIHKLVITDLDGTLLKGDDIVPENYLKLMRKLKTHGVKFAVASGRQYGIIKQLFKDDYQDMLLIGDNGAAIYDGDELIYKNVLDKTLVDKYRALILSQPQFGLLYAGIKTSYCESEDPTLQFNLRRYCHYPCKYLNLEDMLQHDEIGKMAIYNFDGQSQKNLAFFKDYFNEADFVASGTNWIDITPLGTSKGEALKFIKDYYHYTNHDVYAFGDYNNDLSMLKEAYYSFAVDNATKEVKEIANFSCPSNLEEGVIVTLKEHFKPFI